jgi:hypothetical protein
MSELHIVPTRDGFLVQHPKRLSVLQTIVFSRNYYLFFWLEAWIIRRLFRHRSTRRVIRVYDCIHMFIFLYVYVYVVCVYVL